MDSDDPVFAGRRLMLSGLGVAALAVPALAGTSAHAESGPGKFKPRHHPLDAWMDALPGDHRIFVDTDSAAGGANALRYAENMLNIQVNDYAGADRDLALIVCLRHASVGLGFSDAVWAKYGASLNAVGRQPAKDEPVPTKNPHTAAIASAAARGVQFAICNAASKKLSGLFAEKAGLKAEEVYADLVANLVPNGHMVPAGVMAATRAQEFGYSFLYSAA